MKRILQAAVVAASMLGGGVATAQVGVTVTLGDPAFFGRIDVGGAPPPQLIFVEPVVIERATVVRQPVYLRVPPGHEKDWGKHCRKYDACGHPVYFVRDSWYRDVYVPHRRGRHGHGHGDGHEHGDDDHDDHDDHKHGKDKHKGKKD